MKVFVGQECICELSDIKEKVIKNQISSDIYDYDMKRRVNYILTHKYDMCMKELRDEWIPKLKENGVTSVPLDDDEFANLVFSHPNYKDRKQRDDEEKLNNPF